MNSEKWEQAKQLYETALKMGRDERPRFLAENCGGDDELYREVESLLAASDEAGGFLETPAIGEMAEAVVSNRSLAGQKILRYQVVRLLGSGGMGEVYLAEDTRLRRKIALKILPHSLGGDKRSAQRFEQEACAASALNHPNILTVHEFGTHSGMNFIASEFVQGETLRNRLGSGRPRPLSETLDIALQVGAALRTAHASGIIHRDIKPENVMIRDDGLVKVLDFGLAKLTMHSSLPRPGDETLVQTAPGMIMGTVGYMSPEQVRGRETDARTDIWSFGVVLYEMLAGRLPFEGATKSDYIASILRSYPLPLEIGTEEISFELRDLVRKALEKDKESRYQTIKELIGDLNDLKNKISFAGGQGRSDGLGRQGRARRGKTRVGDTKTTDDEAITQTASADEHPLSKTRMHNRGLFVGMSTWIIVIFAAIFAIGLVGWQKLNSSVPSSDAFQKMQLTKLTYEGFTGSQASISPDGKYIVYTLKEDSKQNLAVRQVEGSGAVEIVPPADVSYQGLRFAPDGNSIYYTVYERNKGSALFEIPVLGGSPRKILDNSQGIPAFSRDGKTIAYLNGENSLMSADADGASPNRLAAPPQGEVWKQPAWHPNGNSIVTSMFSPDASRDFLVEISLSDGTETRMPAPWLLINGFAWLADGTGIILCGRDPETKLSQIWYLTYPGGEKRRITNDFSNYAGVSLTADNKSLITVKNERLSNIWVSNEATGVLPHKVTFEEGRDEGMSGIAQAPDGKIIYTVRSAGSTDLWLVNADGSGNRQLTFDRDSNYSPVVSPDGRYIVFISTRSGSDIWRMDVDGGNPMALTDSAEIKSFPRFTPDGKWIVYQQTDANKRKSICKMSMDGGAPVQLAETASGTPAISPDGSSFISGYEEDEQGEPLKLAVYPIEGGKPLKIFDFPTIVKSRGYRLAADGKSLIYRENRGRSSNLWSQSLEGGPPRQITFFESGQIYQFDLMRDGGGFVLARGNESSDVVMISNFR